MPYTDPMRWLFILALSIYAAPASAVETYASPAAWLDDARTLDHQIEAFDKCRGRLSEKPRFSGCIKLWEDAYRRWNRLDGYAAGDPLRAERSRAMGTRLDGAAEFLQPELRALGRVKVARLLASEKLLQKYKDPLEKVLRAKANEPVDARALWKDE